MGMVRTYRYPLEPTVAQVAVLEGWLVCCQQLYNAALQERRDAWHKQGVSVGYNAQSAQLTEVRAADPEIAAMPLAPQRSALKRCDRAFQAFFRRCKSGQKPGYPRFRSRARYDSFDFANGTPPRIDGNRVHVPKLGPVKFKQYRPLRGKLLSVTIRRGADRWWLCCVYDLGEAPPKPVEVAPERTTGIDLGLTAFAVLSDGERVENPRYFRRAEARLAERQRRLQHKRRGSKGRQRARRLVARAHLHVRNQRLDFARKLAVSLVARYDLICYEDLNIKGLAGGMLAKSVADAAWRVFLTALTCKAESAGTWAVSVDPRGTSQRCSRCGAVVEKDLSTRVHDCPCGLVLDRDHNAAINIKALGVSVVRGHPPAPKSRGGGFLGPN